MQPNNELKKHINKALNSCALICFINTKGIITYVNNQFCLFSGYDKYELLNQNYSIVNSNYLSTDVIRDIWDTINQGQTWKGEQSHINKQGHIFWVDSSIVLMRDPMGQIEGFLVVSKDITETKNHEIKMLSFKRALDASTEMMIIIDENYCIQYVNSAVKKVTGWEKEELIGKPASIFNSPNCDPQTLINMEKCLKEDRSWSGRILNRRKGMAPINIAGQTTPPDPKEYWVNMNITPIHDDNDNHHQGYIQIQRDITERVNIELAQEMEKSDTTARISISNVLQQSIPIKERLNQVLDILFELQGLNIQRKGGIFLKNLEQDFLDMYVLKGKFSYEFIRREQRIPLGACLCGRAAVSQKLIISDDCFCDPRHEHHFDGMKAHGHYIIPIISAETTLGILFLYTTPYPSAIESRLAMLQKIGEMLAFTLLQEKVKESLELAKDNAEQTAKAKTAFLANMSHEIRTPMNGVLGMLEMLQDTPLNNEQQGLVKTANNSAESLLVIINDILDFSKLESGKVELENIEFNLPNLVEETCALMANSAHVKNLEFNCFLPPDIQKFWLGDSARIRQILTNLVGNAIKFTETGEVSVEVKVESIKKNKQKNLLFKIKDTGIGLLPEVQPLLFQPFSQADNTTARRFGGTGLGLSISKALVDCMKGEIGVDSFPDQGSCFWFTLPLQASTKNTESISTYDFTGKRALIVDDNQTNRKILIRYLEHWGMKTKAVSNAPEALVYLDTAVKRKESYDIILSDLHMPEMDGFTFSQQINNNPSIALTPRLLLSSDTIPTTEKLLELGFSQSLLKPLQQSQLINAIATALDYEVEKTDIVCKINKTLPNFSNKKVLVAEDNKTNQVVILGMLKKFHIIPDLVENGHKALEHIAHNCYNLVLMDCEMPIMDGYEATRKLRDAELTKKSSRVVVVAVTAHATLGEREKCLAAGMDDYLTKPLSRLSLEKIFKRWLGEPVSNEETHAQKITNTKDIYSCWDKLAALNLIDNDIELFNDMIDIFLSEIPDLLLSLAKALEQNNLSLLADTAHTIKGISGQFCAKKLTTIASNIELNVHQQKSSDFNLLVSEISQEANILIKELLQTQNTKATGNK